MITRRQAIAQAAAAALAIRAKMGSDLVSRLAGSNLRSFSLSVDARLLPRDHNELLTALAPFDEYMARGWAMDLYSPHFYGGIYALGRDRAFIHLWKPVDLYRARAEFLDLYQPARDSWGRLLVKLAARDAPVRHPVALYKVLGLGTGGLVRT